MIHRVYVDEGDVWTLAAVYARRHPLPVGGDAYLVFETPRPPSAMPICLQLDDGRRLCDVGPGHDHRQPLES